MDGSSPEGILRLVEQSPGQRSQLEQRKINEIKRLEELFLHFLETRKIRASYLSDLLLLLAFYIFGRQGYAGRRRMKNKSNLVSDLDSGPFIPQRFEKRVISRSGV